MGREGGRSVEELASVAAALARRAGAVSSAVQDVIERAIPQLRGDQNVVRMLEPSVAENVATMLHMLEHGIDPAGVAAPTAAVEYARRLAQRGVESAALVRAYRVGQARFTRLFVEELMSQAGGASVDGGTVLLAVEEISEYIDRVVGQVLEMYERERASWFEHRSAALSTRVREVLDTAAVDVDRMQTALGYRLRQHHIGLVVWLDDPTRGLETVRSLNDLVGRVGRALGCTEAPLFVPCDESSAWAWLPVGGWPGVADVDMVIAEASVPVSVAVGTPGHGVEGFRRSHRQAVSAQAVALAAGCQQTRVVPFADVAPIAMMCADLDSARAWVAETLGALAVASERNAGLRETARVFLRTGGSYTATADELFLHRNSVQYRVRQAEEVRGRPLTEGRLDVELALLACHWLGASVLEPA